MKYVLLFVLILLYVSQNFFCARYAVHTKTTESHSSFIYTFYLGIFLAIMTFIYNGFKFSASLTTVLLAVLAALCLATFYISMVTASRVGSYIILMISLLFGGIIIPAVMECFINRALPSFMQTIGVVLMLIAILLYNVEFKHKKKDEAPKEQKSRADKIKAYICYVVLFFANGFYGALIAGQQSIENGAHEKEMLIMTFGFAAVMCIIAAIFMPGRRSMLEELKIGKKAAVMFGIAAVSATLAVNVLQIVLKEISITIVYTVDNGGNIFFAALLAYLVFKEKFNSSKVIGTGVIIASIVCLCL